MKKVLKFKFCDLAHSHSPPSHNHPPPLNKNQMASFTAFTERPPDVPKPSQLSPGASKPSSRHHHHPSTSRSKGRPDGRKPSRTTTSSKPTTSNPTTTTTTTTTTTNDPSPSTTTQPAIPLIFSLSEPVDVAHPAIAAKNNEIVTSLESQASKWMATIDAVSQRVRAAPQIEIECSVQNLPLAELEFWEQRTRQLEVRRGS